MSKISLLCPDCGSEVWIEEFSDVGLCPRCGQAVPNSNALPGRHMAIENLLEKGFLNIAIHHYACAAEVFQDVFTLDPHNIYGWVGAMCCHPKKQFGVFYRKVAAAAPAFSKAEARFLNKDTCHAFARAYAWAQDFQRLDVVLSRFPECIDKILLWTDNDVQKAALLLKYDWTPEQIFWYFRHSLTPETLEFLLQKGMDPDAPFPADAAGKQERYTCPLAMALALPDNVNISRSIKNRHKQERLDLAKILLMHGADPHVRVPIVRDTRVTTEVRRRVLLRDCAPSQAALELFKAHPYRKCYVTACLYPDPYAPQLRTLRRLRDNVLNDRWYGKLAIWLFYRISPFFTRYLGGYPRITGAIRWCTDCFVRYLDRNNVGVIPFRGYNKYL